MTVHESYWLDEVDEDLLDLAISAEGTRKLFTNFSLCLLIFLFIYGITLYMWQSLSRLTLWGFPLGKYDSDVTIVSMASNEMN